MPSFTATEDFEVIICGCGPTGALLSANLGRLGVKHLILEKESAITSDPRGIVLDEDGIRCVQGVGKYEELFREVGQCRLALKHDADYRTMRFLVCSANPI